MSTLYLIRGLPHTGKTTLARTLIEQSSVPISHWEFDQFFMDPVTGIYDFRPELVGMAHDYAYGNAMSSLVKGFPVVVSNCMSTQREVDRYMRGADKVGVAVKVIERRGVKSGKSKTPKFVADRMAARWEAHASAVVYAEDV